MGCMHEIGEEKKCPYCGYHADTVQPSPFLPVRTLIGNRYLIGKVVEKNGEGATYIGWDIKDKKAVNIREFIPDSFTTRVPTSLNLQVSLGSEGTFAELRRSFEELWSKLARLNGLSALINVTHVFEDYGTSYAVYDHFDGISLRDFLLRSKTGYLSWEKARQLLMPTLQTLGNLHSNGIIHRGISPTTLVIGEDGKIKITGFSIGEARAVGSRIMPQIFDGYAAVEQYGFDAQQGPWTDIYGFTAVLYRTLIGSDPISSKERMANDRLMVPGKFAEALPAYVINGLINGLQILPQDRTRTVEQLRAELSASPAATAAGSNYGRAPEPTIPNKAPVQRTQNTADNGKKKEASGASVFFKTFLIILLVGVLAGAGLIFALSKKGTINLITPDKGETTTEAQKEQYEVPDFSSYSYDTIQSNAVFNERFKITSKEEYSSDVQQGYIISQSLRAGQLVDKGTEIVLTVSKGTEQIVLPNVVGKDYEQAEEQLTSLGFKVERQDTDEGYYTSDTVIEMSLTENEEYDIGTSVTLKVYVASTTDPYAADTTRTQNYYTTTAPSTTASQTTAQTTLPESTTANEVPTDSAEQ